MDCPRRHSLAAFLWPGLIVVALVVMLSPIAAQSTNAARGTGVEPPHLIFPANRAVVTMPNPVFQWTPVTGVDGLSYRIRLVEMIAQQNPREAVDANRPLVEELLYQQTVLLYPTAAYPLRAGHCYAWQVQSVQPGGSDLVPVLAPVGINGGRSRVNTFCYRPTPVEASGVDRALDETAGLGVSIASPASGSNDIANPSYPDGRSSPYWASGVKATGSITAYGELYDLSGTGGTPARPGQTGRIEVNSTLSFANGQVQVPLQALLSSDQASFRQEINRIGINPTWRDYTLHAGYFAPRLTDLTLADATLLGAGVEGHPGRFHFDLGYGRARRAILPAAGQLVAPEFARWMGMGRIGWQAPTGFLLEASAVNASDREQSLGAFGQTTAAAAPQDNLVLSVHGKVPFSGRRLWLDVEAARSRYKADLRTAAGSEPVTAMAGVAALTWQVPEWSLGGKVSYTAPEYHSLGNTQLQSDLMRYEATGTLHRGTVSLGFQAGFEQNNLNDALASTTKVRGIYSATLGWQPSPVFGVDGSASNVVNDIQSANPMLALKNVNASYVLTPRLAWHTGREQHLLVASGTWQTASNSSPGISGLQDTRTGSGLLAYTLSFPSGMAFTATGTFTQVKVAAIETNLTTVYPALSIPALQGRLQATFGVQWSASGVSGTEADHELYPQLNASFTVTPRQQLTLQFSRRHYAYGDAMPGAAFDETTGNLTWRYTF